MLRSNEIFATELRDVDTQQFFVSKRTFRQRWKLKPFYVSTANFVHKNPAMRLLPDVAPIRHSDFSSRKAFELDFSGLDTLSKLQIFATLVSALLICRRIISD